MLFSTPSCLESGIQCRFPPFALPFFSKNVSLTAKLGGRSLSLQWTGGERAGASLYLLVSARANGLSAPLLRIFLFSSRRRVRLWSFTRASLPPSHPSSLKMSAVSRNGLCYVSSERGGEEAEGWAQVRPTRRKEVRKEMQYVCLCPLSPLLPTQEFTASRHLPRAPAGAASTTMMNATMITYFFLGLSLHFALSEDGFTTVPSSVPSSARSFCPSSTGSISSVLFWPPPPPSPCRRRRRRRIKLRKNNVGQRP